MADSPDPKRPPGRTIIVAAGIGVLINTATALLFISCRKRDLNLRGAFPHMAADAGVSLGVVAAGIGIMYTGRMWIDPLVGLMIAAIILITTWGLLKESVNLALQAVPAGIDAQAASEFLADLPGVTAAHDLHSWAMSATETALTAHSVKPNPENDDPLLVKTRNGLHDEFGIEHVTLQLERNHAAVECDDDCEFFFSRNRRSIRIEADVQ